jgi:hypothetical protein
LAVVSEGNWPASTAPDADGKRIYDADVSPLEGSAILAGLQSVSEKQRRVRDQGMKLRSIQGKSSSSGHRFVTEIISVCELSGSGLHAAQWPRVAGLRKALQAPPADSEH